MVTSTCSRFRVIQFVVFQLLHVWSILLLRGVTNSQLYGVSKTAEPVRCQNYDRPACLPRRLVGWGLTALSTQYGSYRELRKRVVSRMSSQMISLISRSMRPLLPPLLYYFAAVYLIQDPVIITSPPNGPVLYCSQASVVCRRRLSSSVTLPAAGPTATGPGAWAVGWPTLHGGPV